MNYHAAIFDMDGLLLDTERVCMRVFQEACEVQQLPFYTEVYLSIIGRNAAGIEAIFRKAYGNDLDRLHQEWRTRYNAVVKHQAIPVKEGVVELLEWLKEQSLPIAVATSTAKDVAKIKLELAGLSKYIDNLTTGCEVSNGKPDPEIYLLAANRLNVEPTKCLAFEDSNNGVRAAVAANMSTYQIPDLVEPCDEVRQFGHSIVPSLHDVLKELKQTR
ncbi:MULTISPECIES: HAD family hydrolase [Vibrio]|uniref:Phosphatase n=1 Tax=Vibrio natriegens NBRC 15636 = ATCC 14048 = DSM 759 TaxID=1219067 RepID=A0AAN0Y7L8_VIBNA|nr:MULTISPECIES: HAD family phosphatase [Vibrio]ALR18824.1 CbbY [Vibrio natriegens NBRC 15636 = ATCC 14048 = DSM 759]ANQ15658.1 phosphatase [Vibrio natriegens NBRC 15636 = ATCC 14048 = DSM 759]ANQ24936.1 phosphatase [Vibrio natriegens]ANQ29606.1 phosphatase [Vibrio natriegens]MDX6029872.1 HAD family phosphatase [Vibrio natriegens NBRC 15636 = ATCC 14048 = DSM 759]